MACNRETKCFDVVVLGGGASGLMCALSIKGKKVAVVDANSFLAKKLMVTGNGRCNLTNTQISSKNYNQNLDRFLSRFDQVKTLEFFKNLGLVYYSDEEGRVYPLSNSARSVVDVLNLEAKKIPQVFLGEKVNDVVQENGEFILSLDKFDIRAKSLVYALGGGSDEILNNLNVRVKKFVPSLVSLKSNDTRDLNGVRVSDVLVSAKNAKGEIKSEKGEVLFREEGLSGIVIFNISTLFARSGCFEGEVKIDLMPENDISALTKTILERTFLDENLDKLFVGMFVGALANEIFKQAKINTNRACKTLREDEAKVLARTIKNLKFLVNGCLKNNQVFCGGVPLEDLDENLMHKKIKNLFVIGEACDVDGECGGFNLQWAWTSGRIVGEWLC